MNILERIIEEKRSETAHLPKIITPKERSKTSADKRIPRAFKKKLMKPGLGFICEIKKASPSKGVLVNNFDPVKTATLYREAGADCISVLTDREFFMGSQDDLISAKYVFSGPVLRKDFIIIPEQIRESYEIGADCILLIVSCLEPKQLKDFLAISKSFGMSSLVEVHNEEEIEIALKAGSDLIGINNRNLNSFEVSLETSLRLIEKIPKEIVRVSESGISTAADCAILRQAGFDAVLVGESLMRAGNPGELIRSFKSASA